MESGEKNKLLDIELEINELFDYIMSVDEIPFVKGNILQLKKDELCNDLKNVLSTEVHKLEKMKIKHNYIRILFWVLFILSYLLIFVHPIFPLILPSLLIYIHHNYNEKLYNEIVALRNLQAHYDKLLITLTNCDTFLNKKIKDEEISIESIDLELDDIENEYIYNIKEDEELKRVRRK